MAHRTQHFTFLYQFILKAVTQEQPNERDVWGTGVHRVSMPSEPHYWGFMEVPPPKAVWLIKPLAVGD